MKKLCSVVNIIPVIAKADTLSEEEVVMLKEKVRQELLENSIEVYDCTADDSDLTQQEMEQIQNKLPYTVIGANTVISKNGKKMLGREYPWGIVEVENPEHCDFSFLKSMLLGTHMSDLQNSTHEHLYEEFRKIQLEANGISSVSRRSPEQIELDTQLEEKQLEIEKMKEQMRILKEQLGISIPVTS
ncbi:Septin-1-like [Oopsacas minuta]|uniref:Septin-1-like n=1 Tax=Oopsacas minuta TaxID=111878 RepID=A0AAV7JY77_9METZ|nr:Septin-1-like [Oopsacas minuta]